ncbi:hypothetical protein [Brevibacillus sp. HB2.2]|uniref:hypothetical protein n=1 Tax=Brevibacillus sp. HB2.2 TaxID=2738846 RepID=UPI00156A9570|nr:hypothetical protein [Brevibacillus sp. HB2.2]NRS48720.1 hypothetical protein [Brevibacillus sp. HB2.2]
MSKRKALAFTLMTALLLSNSAVLTTEAAAKASSTEEEVISKKLTAENLDDNAKATLELVKEVMPDMEKYDIIHVRVYENLKTRNGDRIDQLEVELMGTPEGEKPHHALVRMNAKTGELIGAEIANGLLKSEAKLNKEEATKKGFEYLKHFFGEKADKYGVSDVRNYVFGDGAKQILVIYTAPDHDIYVTMDSEGELKAAKKDMLIEE